MSRHNRRRSRGGRKHAARSMAAAMNLADEAGSAAWTHMVAPEGMHHSFAMTTSPAPVVIDVDDFADRIPQLPPSRALQRGATPTDRMWHNRYLAWQAQELEQQRMSAMIQERSCGPDLAMQTCRATGRTATFSSSDSDGSDDDGDGDGDGYLDADADAELDAKMMDYFHGLDWLV